MEKFDELLKKLNDLKILQKSMSWEENIPDDIWKEYFEGNWKLLEDYLNPDAHGWYELITTVIGIYDRFLGIRLITNLFSEESEESEVEDCFITIHFYEMEEIQKISYKIKETNN
jgi:hypothetical protein